MARESTTVADARVMQSIEEYCKVFQGFDQPWPALPLKPSAQERWWAEWLANTTADQSWSTLRKGLPQLWITPHPDAAKSEAYKRLVLRGESPNASDQAMAPSLQDPEGLTISLAAHPCGSIPVLEFRHHDDFVLVVRCLAHRCASSTIQPTVHAQAVAGLIHWGLIRELGRDQRAQLLILHRAPYSSLSSSVVPGQLSEEEWIERSRCWRLEHELTHIACKRLVGEMRINLFDELIADALGMLAAMGWFNAELFRLGLGCSDAGDLRDDARAHVYLQELATDHHRDACRMVMQRARELEAMLQRKELPQDRMQLLHVLTHNRLDQPLTRCP